MLMYAVMINIYDAWCVHSIFVNKTDAERELDHVNNDPTIFARGSRIDEVAVQEIDNQRNYEYRHVND